MHQYVNALRKVASRYAPSRVLSFDIVHVFKALQLVGNNGHASRNLLCKELALGEGAVKTLVKHMKMNGMIETTKAGTKLTAKGTNVRSGLLASMPAEMSVPKCSIALGKFNHAVLLRQFGFAVKSGIEQRDCAIKMGALGATTLLFRDDKFVMPNKMHDSLKRDPHVGNMLRNLGPEEGDVIIIGSDDKDRRTAELAAKNAALFTIVSHENHLL